MDSTTRREGNTLLGLISGLREDVRDLFHEEIKLAKTEVSEKVSHFSRNGVYLGIGAAIGYMAGMFLLLALGILIAVGFEALGLETGTSLFLGFLAIAIVAGLIGGILVMKALSAFKKESLMPEKTIETLKEIKQGGLEQSRVVIKTYEPEPEPRDHRSSDQIRADLQATRGRIGREVRGIRTRLGLATAAVAAADHFRRNPVRSLSLGLGTGLAGYVLMRRRRRVR